jgi:hypothetical protein
MIKTSRTISNRVWLVSGSFCAMRWSVWKQSGQPEGIEGYLELTDGRTTVHIHSADPAAVGKEKSLEDFVAKLNIMLQMLGNFIKIDPTKDTDFVDRVWLNPEESHFSGSMVVYLKHINDKEYHLGLKISCCKYSLTFYPHNSSTVTKTKLIAKRISVQINKMLDAINELNQYKDPLV